MALGLQKLTNRITTRFPVFASLARSKKSLLISAVVAVVSYASRFLDWGVKILDWAQRTDFLWLRRARLIEVLKWFVSPTGADLIFLVAVIIFFLAVILAVSPKTKPAATAPAPTPELPAQPKPKLTFDIDENESSASAKRYGSHVSRITADINLRCEKETDSMMVVRAFHLSLFRLETDGKATLIPYQKENQIIWESANGKLVPFSEGWTIDKPRSEYRHYNLTIEITPQAQAELSSDHFLQLTMDAIGQDEVSKAIYVKDWSEEYSPISLKPFEVFSPGAQQEISALKGKLRSYEKTNEELGQRLTQAKDKHKAEITEVKDALRTKERELAQSEEGHKLEITGTRIELNQKKEELEAAIEGIREVRKAAAFETLRLTNELELVKPSERLREMEERDAAAIHDAVVLSAVQFRNETTQGFRHVDFIFSIFNQSIYPISIDSIGPGDIVFNRDEFVKEKKLQDNTAQNVEPRREGNFTVRQYLDDGDIRAINEAMDDRQFRFDNLKINIKGGKGYENVVTASELKIDCYSLSKQYPLWHNFNVGPFHSRFNGEITGQIREVYFQSNWLDLFTPGEEQSYNFDFILHVYIVNHGTPKSIEEFKFAIEIGGATYVGERESLAGFRVLRRNDETQLLKDVEDDNDEMLIDRRGGWLRFRVRDVKGYKENCSQIAIDLNAVDTNLEPNRLKPLPHSRWLGHAQFQESHISGTGEWQESEMTTEPEAEITLSRNTTNA